MKQAMNPFLPLWEYIPDGEPHVFGDRLYLFGSHDQEGGDRYCALSDYVGWSAPLSDLSDWTCHGQIYHPSQDPDYTPGGMNDLYAPDVVRGNDGRYYLYYCMEHGPEAGLWSAISVAVCDTPAGKYEYLGTLRNPDGSRFQRYLPGDPGVMNDNGVIRLYYGWSLSLVAAAAHNQGGEVDHSAKMIPHQALYPVEQMLFKRSLEELQKEELCLMGANTVVLDEDMLTVSQEPQRIVPGQFQALGTGFEGHAFYEASAIKRIGELYYFIYSSQESHELCYATSRFPDRDFRFRGILHSNADVGYQGRKDADRVNFSANNHGNLECVNGQWYIFYHRHTHNSTYSRQACAEPVTIAPDGTITQAECTTSGLAGPLVPQGFFAAPYCCNLTNGHMPHATNTVVDGDIPYITHEGQERFITNIMKGTRIAYKYFDFRGGTAITVTTRGAAGTIRVTADEAGEQSLCQIPLTKSENWQNTSASFHAEGLLGLHFHYQGAGTIDFLGFALEG